MSFASRTVLTCGVFDLFHVGHVNFLERCAELGDELVVAIMTDRWTEEFKKRRPIFDQESRARIVRALKGVSKTIWMDTIDPTCAMVESQCSVFAHGNDWLRPGEDLSIRIPELARAHILAQRIEIVLVPYTAGVSSSGLRTYVAPS